MTPRPLAALFATAGRLDRGGWWLRLALVGALFLAQAGLASDTSLDLFADLLGRRPATLALVWGGVALAWIAGIGIFVAASVRRLHDRGHSGLRLLAFALPAIVAAHWLASLWFAWLAFLPALAWGVIELGVLPAARRADAPPR